MSHLPLPACRRTASARRLFLASLVVVLTSCSRSGLGRLVGGNRDDHGCLTAAGYTWSDARHDCVRIWEVGRRFDGGTAPLYLIFSTDSAYAELFTEKGAPILCRRVKGQQVWNATQGQESVSIGNEVITIHTDGYNYTQSASGQ